MEFVVGGKRFFGFVFKVSANNEKSCLRPSMNVACADCLQLNLGA